MKKIFLLLALVSFSLHAQFKISGEMNPSGEYTWVILYKIEGARQVFIKSEKVAKGKFSFKLPANAKTGAYRVNYKTEGSGFADFLFNKEDVAFTFDPEKAEETIRFSKSTENKLYQEYINTVSTQQYKTDSLQIAYLKNPQEKTASLYKTQLAKIAALQKQYLAKSKGKMVYHFIKATNRYNNPVIAKDPQMYLKSINDHFFDTIDFGNQALYNSTFLVDRITDYVFYMNYSDDPTKQRTLHDTAVKKVLSRTKNQTFKKDIIEFLITQFVNANNIEFADYVLDSYYKKLPKSLQSTEFTVNYLERTAVGIGRIAPEITWNTNGKNYKLSTINEANNYVLVFWSTGCGHCLREVPQLYEFTKDVKNSKVIAFGMEINDSDWKKHTQKYTNWHHVLGLKKWENTIARKYQIYATPTYIVLDKNKKIIAKPETLEELKQIIKYIE
ncbi:thioredoxin-like domain-containing protein [Polaribacter gochangensis]|uniref:thioredoxin-like domain-containing protein n=1 Tax=Polaribacter gochangensis TaxID=3252903 RepID=UPI003904DCA6